MPDTADVGTNPGVLSGTDLHKAYGQVAGAAVETANEQAVSYGSMGLGGTLKTYGNATAMLVIVAWISIGAPIAFFWLRSDAKEDRNEYRQQVAAERQLAEERRREDRQDRQRIEDLFRQTLETIARDGRDSSAKMATGIEQIKIASEQIKLASEAMVRLEKVMTAAKQPTGPIP